MRIKLTFKCHSLLTRNHYYITDLFSVNHLKIEIRNSNFPLHMEKIIPFSPKCSQPPTGWQGLYVFEGFGVGFFFPKPPDQAGKQQPLFSPWCRDNQSQQLGSTQCHSGNAEMTDSQVSPTFPSTALHHSCWEEPKSW